MISDLNHLQESLQKKLKPKRYIHTLGVQYTAGNLAMRYGYNIEKAQAAGLLHDCAKYLSDKKLMEKCEEHHIPITPVERRNPYLLHGKLGAYYAERKYNINDPEIISAIHFHTTGKPNMSLLEKIIFTADYIEPGRKEIPGLKQVRKIAYLDLDQTVYYILKYTLEYLEHCQEQDSKEIDPMTRKAYEYYRNQKGDLE